MTKLNSAKVKKLGRDIVWESEPKPVKQEESDNTPTSLLQMQMESTNNQVEASRELYGMVLRSVQDDSNKEVIELLKQVNKKPKGMLITPKRSYNGLAESYTVKFDY